MSLFLFIDFEIVYINGNGVVIFFENIVEIDDNESKFNSLYICRFMDLWLV